MLSLELVNEISRLLREGELSQRQIAARLEVSRGTVGAMASGRRGLEGGENSDEASRARAAGRRPKRCRRCGYRVYPPCLVCITRDYRQQQLAGIKPSLDQAKPRKLRRRVRKAN